MGAAVNDLQDLRSLAFEAAPAPALLIGADRSLLAANEAAEMLFGQSLGSLARGANAALGPEASDLVDAAFRHGHASAHDLEILVAGALICRADLTAARLGERGALVTLTPRDSFGRAQAAGMSSLGELGRALAHEIKNPLAGIRGAAQLLRDGAKSEDVALADVIVAETERIRRLADRMESLAEEGPARRQPVNIHRVLDRVGALAASAMSDGVTVRHVYDPSLPEACGDEDQLLQVFLNLVKNASEAIVRRGDGRGEILIATAYRHQPRSRPEEVGGKRLTPLEVRIRDNGPGVEPAIRDRLFQPFVSGRAGGSGLGLALTARLVAIHDGVIDFESEPGRTTFRVLLPVAAVEEAR
jgi:two-component system nitrogen regulation sensor histidine kinase GlnL